VFPPLVVLDISFISGANMFTSSDFLLEATTITQHNI